jgi:hypothetical protein
MCGPAPGGAGDPVHQRGSEREEVKKKMRKALTLAVILLLASPNASWAVGSFSLTESDLIGTTSISESLSVSKLSGLTFGTVTVGTVALALEIEEMKPSAQSPHHNVTIISAGVLNTAGVSSNGGLTTVQQTAGGSNVTMTMNNIVVGGGGLISSAPSASATNNPTVLLVGVLNQPFTVKNSYWFAQVLNKKLLVDAFIAGSASNGNAIAEDIITVGLNEFSPHHNLGITATAVNDVTVVGNFGIVTVQQTAGFANVTEAMNTMIVGTGIFSTSGVTVSP